MNLNRSGREFYELQIVTTTTDGDPITPDAWEASFDKGTSWVPATVLTHDAEDYSAWLLAGSLAEEGTAVAVISRSVEPLVRAIDNPEIIVRTAPKVTIK